MSFAILFCWLVSSDLLTIMPSDECQRILLMISQHCMVMAWCRQATSHYLRQYWPSSLSPYGVTRPQWVKSWITLTPPPPPPPRWQMHTHKESMLWSICRTIADNCSWVVLPNRETDGIWILAFDSGLKVMNLDRLIDMLWTYVMDRYMQVAKQAISKRVKKFVVTIFEGGYNWAKSSIHCT